MAATKTRKSTPGKVKNPEAVEIGERIRARRQALGLNRKALAAMLHTRAGGRQSEGKIAQWEQGQNVPTADRRQELADALQTTTGHLFGEAQDAMTLHRLDLIERKIDAVISIQGLGDLVEAKMREYRLEDRRRARGAAKGQKAGPSQATKKAAKAIQRKASAQGQRKARATPKKRADG